MADIELEVQIDLTSSGQGTLTFKSEDIISCNIIEEVDPISNKLPINTCNVVLYSDKDIFNILNSEGISRYLNRGIPFTILAKIPNQSSEEIEELNFGKFYLDTWDGTHRFEGQFHLVSILGILDKIRNKSEYYIPSEPKQLYSNVLNDIYNKLPQIYKNLFTFDTEELIDSPTNELQVTGLLPAGASIKDWIQTIAFSGNLTVEDSRSKDLIISPIDYDYQDIYEEEIPVIDKSEIFDQVKITSLELVTDVSVNVNYYFFINFIFDDNIDECRKNGRPLNPAEDYTQLNNLPINPNTGKINKNTKYSYSSEHIISSYLILKSETNNDDWIREYEYSPESQEDLSNSFTYIFQETAYYRIYVSYVQKRTEQILTKELPNIENRQRNSAEIKDNPLITGNNPNAQTTGNAEECANNLLKYYSAMKLQIEFECLCLNNLRTGRKAHIWTPYGDYVSGFITKQEINLAGGFLTKVTALCDNNYGEMKYYMLDLGFSPEEGLDQEIYMSTGSELSNIII